MWKKALSIVLCGFMILCGLPGKVAAEQATCAHHPVHTADCGYQPEAGDASCTYQCDLCAAAALGTPTDDLTAEEEPDAIPEGEAAPTPEEGPSNAPEEEPSNAPENQLLEETITVFGGEIEATDFSDNNQALLDAYVESLFYATPGISLFSSSYGENLLTGLDLEIYQQHKPQIENVAKNGGSTKFQIKISTPMTWNSTATSQDQLKAEADKFFQDNIDMKKILDAILLDCSYEAYWFGKTWGCGYACSATEGIGSIQYITITWKVDQAYAAADYEVDATKAQAAVSAVANANTIVAACESMSTYEKLKYFKDEICNLVSYDNNAAGTGYSTDGNPWQLVYVFDQNPDTNVVCEGYSKAFKYLCDLSGITCYTVSGDIDGGHMWNIVTLDGKNYLVDVTNSDTGTIGQNGGLFLNAPVQGNILEGYTFSLSTGKTLTYRYYEKIIALYGAGEDSILNLAMEDYSPPAFDGLPGDLNGDGAIKLYDALLLCRLINGYDLPEGTISEAGDVNQDGKKDQEDIEEILKILIQSAA